MSVETPGNLASLRGVVFNISRAMMMGPLAISGIGNLINKIVDPIKSVFKGIADGINGIISSVVEWVKDLPTSIKNSIIKKIQGWTGASNGIDQTKPDITPPGGLGKFGLGKNDQYYSQLDPSLNMQYNASGDSQVQTMADSGCGPVSASNTTISYE